ncbi:MAG: Dyp-type peroxidase [Ketobacter sp.]|nr:Dyp-type peroxidase [Ketobacter sp.]
MNPGKNQLQLDDIQAHLIRSARPSAARYFFLTITDPVAFAGFLGREDFQRLVISDQALHTDGGAGLSSPCFVNVAFTYSGLDRMGLPQHLLAQFPPAYRDGMARRSAFIGDQWGDDPRQWEGFYGSRHIHVLLAVNYVPSLEDDLSIPPQEWSEAAQKQHFSRIDQTLTGLLAGGSDFPGAQCLAQEQAHVIRYQRRIREHFGFTDGVSQPRINDGMPGCAIGGKKASAEADWEPLAAGEFVLGYYDELGLKNDKAAGDGRLNPMQPRATDPARAAYQKITMNGSFLVYRKLEQDVAGFRDYCAGDDELAARLVGRQYDGTPLVSGHPGSKDNAFDFGDDPRGEHCPYASHVRRVNPRLTLNAGVNDGTTLVDQHRIIRRGMPYGSFIQPDQCHKSAPVERRGLHFFCYNARIDSQFEFIQKNWINNCDFMHMPSPVLDPVVGCRPQDDPGQFSFNAERAPVFGLKQYVQLKGGEYFFTPGRRGLQQIAGLAQPIDPFIMPKQHIDAFDPLASDPLDVARYVDASGLIAGKRFTKLKVTAGDVTTPYYYFAHPEDVIKILSQPNVFTNDHYARRIYGLTESAMLLSRPDSAQRQKLKHDTIAQLEHTGFVDRLKHIIKPEIEAIGQRFRAAGQLDLVEDVARRLPLVVIKGFYGVAAPQPVMGEILSKTQVAHFFDKTHFDELPLLWQQRYADYGFKTTPDETLLFWVRMLFLEVFLNQYNVGFITQLAKNATNELLPHLEQQIQQRLHAEARGASMMSRFITLYRNQYGLEGRQLVLAVRQSILELMVGSTDTTAKGISMVVKTLLDIGNDLPGGFRLVIGGNTDAQNLLQHWLAADERVRATLDAKFDQLLNSVITTCLRKNPVAPLLPRYCTSGATYTTSAGEVINIEPGAVVCLVSQVTLGANLKGGVPPEQERFIFMDGTPHGCMGHEIAMLEIREALKMLLAIPQVRPAAGAHGVMTEKYKMPARMMLRCNS